LPLDRSPLSFPGGGRAVSEIFEVPPSELLNTVARSLRGLEPHDGSPMADRVRGLIEGAGKDFVSSARPRGMWQPISSADFAAVYHGDGGNDRDTPLELVLEDAVSLALFAVTVGEDASNRISRLFEAGEMAEGYIFDQVASFAADEMAQIATRLFERAEHPAPAHAALPYSPGYCGWNVSGQRALFARLEPGEIGITLNDSCLMAPIKSVSGVVVLAPVEAHCFSPSFTCCSTCTTLNCQERAAALTDSQP
jgi:hypothetical protein